MKDIPLSRPDLARIYRNLGGEERLARILEVFYARMAQDVMIGFFFFGKDLNTIAAKQREFLMRAMGATNTYSGKPPARAHDELPPIRRGMFDRRLRILEDVLREHAVAEEDIRTWIAFEEAFRDAVSG